MKTRRRYQLLTQIHHSQINWKFKKIICWTEIKKKMSQLGNVDGGTTGTLSSCFCIVCMNNWMRIFVSCYFQHCSTRLHLQYNCFSETYYVLPFRCIPFHIIYCEYFPFILNMFLGNSSSSCCLKQKGGRRKREWSIHTIVWVVLKCARPLHSTKQTNFSRITCFPFSRFSSWVFFEMILCQIIIEWWMNIFKLN